MKLIQIKYTYVVQLLAVVLLSFMFIFAGGTKLLGSEMHIDNFNNWGLPIWFMYFTGSIELLSVILLIIPFTRFYGASLLAGTMIGAVLIHLVALEYSMLNFPIFLLGISSFIAWQNRPSWIFQLFCSFPVQSINKSSACTH